MAHSKLEFSFFEKRGRGLREELPFCAGRWKKKVARFLRGGGGGLGRPHGVPCMFNCPSEKGKPQAHTRSLQLLLNTLAK